MWALLVYYSFSRVLLYQLIDALIITYWCEGAGWLISDSDDFYILIKSNKTVNYQINFGII